MSKHKDEFGDRMKHYEGMEAGRKFMPLLPIMARIDGRTFSTFTRPFRKPFDQRLTTAMQEMTKALVEHTHARIGYTQSDEVTLIFHAEEYGSSVFFDGRISKMTSVLAAMATAHFIRALDSSLVDYDEEMGNFSDLLSVDLVACTPHFDCRVWQVPNKAEAANTLLWRNMDARKNGISSACRAEFSPSMMYKKSQADMIEMLSQVGINYEDSYSRHERMGTFYRRETFETEIDDETWEGIPEVTRNKMSRKTVRSRVVDTGMEDFSQCANRVEFVFDGAPAYMYE